LILPSINEQQGSNYVKSTFDNTKGSAMRDYTENNEDDSIYAQLIIEGPPEFHGT